VVVRTGNPAAGKENLIDVRGGDVIVDGTKLATAAINVAGFAGITPATTSVGVGIFASPYNSEDGVGGKVEVKVGYVHGSTGAIDGNEVDIGGTSNEEGEYSQLGTDIKSLSGVTVKSRKDVNISNPNAKIQNTNGVANTETAPSAVVYSAQGSITVFYVDSIKAGAGATCLVTREKDQTVTVESGVVKSITGPAIVSTGNVVVDKRIDGQERGNGIKDVFISSGTAISGSAAIQTTLPGATVYVGYAKVEATGTSGLPSAIRTIDGGVTVEGTTRSGIN